MNYSKLNEKKSFVKDKIIVGIDIAKKKHFATIMLPDGRIPCKPFPFYNSGYSFKKLLNLIKEVKKKYGFEHVVVAMEPSGHYWEPLAHYLDKQGFPMVFVSTVVVKKTRECMDLARSKNDSKDSYLVAQVTSEGKFSIMVLPKGPYANLRRLSSFRNTLMKKFSGFKNMVKAIMDTYFPEYEDLFSDIFGKTSIAILENYPFPWDIKKMGISKLSALVKVSSSMRLGKKKSEKIYEAALCSVGVQEGIDSARLELWELLLQIGTLKLQLERVSKEMRKCLDETGLSEYLLSIPGVGLITAATIIGEIGDLSNYRSFKELIKLAGLNLVENQSGDRGGKVYRISRAGRGTLRQTLYMGVISCLKNNYTIRAYYLRLVDKGVPKKKAIVAAMCKLLRIIFALCKKGEYFRNHEGSKEIVETLKKKIGKKKSKKIVKKAA